MKRELVAAAGAGAPGRAASRSGTSGLREARVRGWGIAADGGPCVVRVLVEGHPAPIELRRIDRPDQRRRHVVAEGARIGFHAEIDPGAWALARTPGRLGVQLELDGVSTGAPGVLDAAALAAWAKSLALWKRPDEREVWRLLAHVAAAGVLARLPRNERDWIERAATQRGLADALRHADPAARIAQGARVHVMLMQAGPFEWQGCAFDASGAEPVFRLETPAGDASAEPRRHDEPELARALGAAGDRIGFTLPVPPSAWHDTPDRGAGRVALRIQGRLVSELVLDADSLRREMSALAGFSTSTGVGERASGARRLALLSEHLLQVPASVGWSSADAQALVELEAAFAAPPPAPFEETSRDASTPRQTSTGQPAPPRLQLESWEGLILRGWACDATTGGEVITLECNGEPLECLVLRTTRGDVSQALGVRNEFLGFEIQLPADVWRFADPHDARLLMLKVNGQAALAEPLRLDDAALERAVIALLPAPGTPVPPLDDVTGMRLRLTAVPLLMEHLQERGGGERLSAPARARLESVGKQLALGRALGLDSPVRPAEAERELLLRQRRVWRLQRLFNASLARHGGASRPAIERSLDDLEADPDCDGLVRTQFLMSLVPLASRCGTLDRLVGALPLETLAWHSAQGDNWALSVHLAIAARLHDHATSAGLLARIAAQPGRGWINTECVALAVDEAIAEVAALPDPQAAVVRAYLELLRAMSGGLWSRRHDRALVETSVHLVASDVAWPPALERELVRTILDAHGLVPGFWQALDAAAGPRERDLRMAAAHRLFDDARMFWDDDSGALRTPPEGIAELVWRLDAAARRGQDDARPWLRELCLRVAAAAAADPTLEPQWAAARVALADLPESAERARMDLHPALTVADMAATAREVPLHAPERPSLWPSDVCPQPGRAAGDNRLRLLSGRPFGAGQGGDLLVICVVRNERVMLPHFLAHYRRLGVREFVFVDNLSDDDSISFLRAQPDVVLYSADTDYRDSHYGVAWQQAVLAAHAAGRWALLADADEFLLYPGFEQTPVATVLRGLEARGHDAATALMIDLYPRAALRDVDFTRQDPALAAEWMDRPAFVRWHLGGGLYSEGGTWLSALRHRLIPDSPPNAYTTQKVALLRWRPWVRLAEGLHYASGLDVAEEPLYFGHYKYHAAFRDKVVREVERKQHFDGASEYRQYLRMVAAPDASLYDATVSVRLASSADLELARESA